MVPDRNHVGDPLWEYCNILVSRWHRHNPQPCHWVIASTVRKNDMYVNVTMALRDKPAGDGLSTRTFDVESPSSEHLVCFGDPLHVVHPSLQVLVCVSIRSHHASVIGSCFAIFEMGFCFGDKQATAEEISQYSLKQRIIYWQ